MKKRSPVKNGDRFLSFYLTATSAILGWHFSNLLLNWQPKIANSVPSE